MKTILTGWQRPFAEETALALAYAVILLYWIAGLTALWLEAEIVPPVLSFALYFAHYSAWGGLLSAIMRKVVPLGDHAVFWGAVAGALLAALLMT